MVRVNLGLKQKFANSVVVYFVLDKHNIASANHNISKVALVSFEIMKCVYGHFVENARQFKTKSCMLSRKSTNW